MLSFAQLLDVPGIIIMLFDPTDTHKLRQHSLMLTETKPKYKKERSVLGHFLVSNSG